MAASAPDPGSTAEVLGVTVAAWPPVGVQHVRLRRGLNALYGKNGVGKTRLLTEIDRLLRATASRPTHEAREVDPLSPSWAFYSAGGIHLREPISRSDVERHWQEDGHTSISRMVSNWVSDGPWWDRRKPGVDFDGSEVPIPPESSLLARLELSESDLFWYLEQGAWFLQPHTQRLYLCDPEPYGSSPLAGRWRDESDLWRKDFEKLERGGDRPHIDFRVGRLESGDDSEVVDLIESTHHVTWTFPGMGDTGMIRRGVPARALMPLPEALQLASAPDWVGLPFLAVPGTFSWRCAVISDGLPDRLKKSDAPTTRWSLVVEQTLAQVPHQLDRSAVRERDQLRESVPSIARLKPRLVHFDDAVDHVATVANELLADLFDDAPILRCRRLPQERWLKGDSPIVWEANTSREGPWFPLEDLGEAHLRYATFSIHRAFTSRSRRAGATASQGPSWLTSEVDGGSFVLIDEPERALHSAAEVRVARLVSTLGDRALVSTHSTEFLDAASMLGAVQRVERGRDGLVAVHSDALALAPPDREAIADRWGMTPARLATLIKVFVLVEGPHDQLVIEHFAGEDLRASQAVVLPLYGTHDLHHVAMSEWLFRSSDASFLVCVDNASQSALSRIMAGLDKRRQPSQQLGFLRDEHSGRGVTPEMMHIIELLRAAVETGNHERIRAFGFRKQDIAEYLPVHLIDPRFRTWTELNRAYLASMQRRIWLPGDGKQKKKKWVNLNGGNYSVQGITRALKQLRDEGETSRHRDFDQLAFEVARRRA